MQQSSFVTGNSYTNLVRAFKPQASFPFGHTGGARGGSYSISYNANLITPGNSIFDSIYKNPSTGISGGTPVTLDPNWNTPGVYNFTGGNLITGPCAGPYENVRATVSHTTLKRYWEVTPSGSNIDYTRIGIQSSAWTNPSPPNNATHCVTYYCFAKETFCGTHVTYGLADVIGIAWDIPNRLIWFRKNGTWINDNTPDSGLGGCAVPGALDFYPCSFHGWTHVSHAFNFGATAFVDSLPAGFVAYNT
jgi:hypothetical protein